MTPNVEAILKILLALLLGGLIGGEREFHDKSAGFRTMIVICLGATLFTMMSTFIGQGNNPATIAANIVTGIGFLGAGAILREGNKIIGLTTASSIWLAAAVGMAIGAGRFALAGLVTVAALVVLWAFRQLESGIDNLRRTRVYQVTCKPDPEMCPKLEAAPAQHGLKLRKSTRTKASGSIMMTLQVVGSASAHQALVDAWLIDPDVIELTY